MKDIGKLRKIYEGFFGEGVIDEVANMRREICKVCPYNSENDKSMCTFDKFRKTFTAPFCTICKCQIFEKTRSPHEKCAMYQLEGGVSKWNRIKFETMDKNDLNFININPKKDYDISLINNKFVIDYGMVQSAETVEVDFFLEYKGDLSFTLVDVVRSCGCQVIDYEFKENGINVHLEISTSDAIQGFNYKDIDIVYRLGDEQKVQGVSVKYYKL